MLFKVYNFNGERVRITKRLSCRRIQCGWVSVIYTDAIEDGDTVQIGRSERANVFVAHTVHRLIDNLPWLICVHGVSISSTDPTTVVAFGGVGSETHLVTVRAGHMMMTEDAKFQSPRGDFGFLKGYTYALEELSGAWDFNPLAGILVF